MNGPSPKIREEFYKKIPFVVDCDIYSNEFNEGFADILLPDACYLGERRLDGNPAQLPLMFPQD